MGPFSMTNMVGVGRCNVRVQKAKMGRFLKNKARKKDGILKRKYRIWIRSTIFILMSIRIRKNKKKRYKQLNKKIGKLSEYFFFKEKWKRKRKSY